MVFSLWILRQKIGNELQRAHRHRERTFSEALTDSERDGDMGPLDPPDPDENPAELLERKENAERIRAAMSHLSEFCQTVFAGLLEGMRMSEIWERFRVLEPGLQRSAFDKRTFACRRKLYTLMGSAE
jgi:DNA-directed RNA polymerase specialized sigma24 family protein